MRIYWFLLLLFWFTIIGCGPDQQSENAHFPSTYEKWSNGLVDLMVDTNQVIVSYHGQCYYFYEVNHLNDSSFQLIWGTDMDCKVDIGIDTNFNLRKSPTSGEPFAKYTIIDSILSVEYYYPEWVKLYGERVEDRVYTKIYFRNK